MNFIKDILSAILAGVMISLGGTVYLACSASENAALGAFLFSIGLTVILVQGFLLFTGKTAYLFENKPEYILQLCLIWIGNMVGCMLTGALINIAKPSIGEKAAELCETKLTQSPWQTVILAAFCGILVYIAVDHFRSDDDKRAFSKYLIVFTCVPAFILCGFEHSIADMFYFAVSTDHMLYSARGILYILLVTLGNLVGAVLFHTAKKAVISNK